MSSPTQPIDWNAITPILAVLVPLLLAILAGIGWLYRHEKERRESVERQLSEHKYKTYMRLLQIFFDVMKNIKAGRVTNETDLIDKMYDANKDLMIYGSDEVVQTYHGWLVSSRNGDTSLKPFADTVVAIRKDMGNPKTKITSEEILRQLIIDYDNAKAKGIV